MSSLVTPSATHKKIGESQLLTDAHAAPLDVHDPLRQQPRLSSGARMDGIQLSQLVSTQ